MLKLEQCELVMGYLVRPPGPSISEQCVTRQPTLAGKPIAVCPAMDIGQLPYPSLRSRGWGQFYKFLAF